MAKNVRRSRVERGLAFLGRTPAAVCLVRKTWRGNDAGPQVIGRSSPGGDPWFVTARCESAFHPRYPGLVENLGAVAGQVSVGGEPSGTSIVSARAMIVVSRYTEKKATMKWIKRQQGKGAFE
jgi:hypothetical protein